MNPTLFRILSLLVLFAYSFNPVQAKHYSIGWVNSIGGKQDEKVTSVALGSDGCIYSVGGFNDTLNFSPNYGSLILSGWNPPPLYRYTTFIYKTDKEGNPIWVKKLSGHSFNDQSTISLDSMNNIYISGLFSDTVDFDPGLGKALAHSTQAQQMEPFFLKLDSAGTFIYLRKWNYLSNFPPVHIVDSSGSVYLTAVVNTLKAIDTIDLDPGVGVAHLPCNLNTFLPTTRMTTFIVKLDKNGNYVWGKTYFKNAKLAILEPKSIALDSKGNILLVGRFNKTVDFDLGSTSFNLTSKGIDDIFLTKIENTGGFLWTKSIGGLDVDWANSIAADKNGNVFVTGFFSSIDSSVVDFDPGPGTFNLTTNGGNGIDMFVLKLDERGNFVWAKAFGGPSIAEAGLSVGVTNLGFVYTLGCLSTTSLGVDLDPGPGVFNVFSSLAAGSHHMALSLLDTGGDFIWGGLLTPDAEAGIEPYRWGDVVYDQTAGTYFIAGGYRTFKSGSGVIDFDPGPNVINVKYVGDFSIGLQNDIFLLGLKPCIVKADTISLKGCDSLIFRGRAYTKSGTFIDSTIALAGICDSIFTLQLTMATTTVDTLNISTCDSLLYNGQVYNSDGTFIHVFSKNGCDSTVVLNLNITGPTPDSAIIKSGNTLTSLAAGVRYQWIDCIANQPIADATTQSFTPKTEGSYAVIVTGSGGCSNTSACYTTNGNSKIAELFNGNQITVFPNPIHKSLCITTTLPLENAHMKIVNVSGQILYEYSVLKGRFFTFDVTTLPIGVYTIYLRDLEQDAAIKIVKF